MCCGVGSLAEVCCGVPAGVAPELRPVPESKEEAGREEEGEDGAKGEGGLSRTKSKKSKKKKERSETAEEGGETAGMLYCYACPSRVPLWKAGPSDRMVLMWYIGRHRVTSVM